MAEERQKQERILVVLTGLPSSGKSTFAARLALALDESHGLTAMAIASDTVRGEIPLLAERFLPETENAVRRLSLARVRDGLREGFPVIFDDLNYYRSMRRQLYALARDLRVPHFLVHLATPEKECLALNAARGRKIPDSVIVTDAIRFDPPGQQPWDKAFLTLTAREATAEKVAWAAREPARRAGEFVPPLEEPGTGPRGQTLLEELDILSRRVLGEFYRRGEAHADSAALRKLRLDLVEEAARLGLSGPTAEKFFRTKIRDRTVNREFPP